MEKYLLGIDIGTTGTKTYLFDETGKLRGKAYQKYGIVTPKVGWSEQNPDDWWDAIVVTVHNALKMAGTGAGKNVAAISISTQGGTVFPVDGKMKPLYNAIVWNDRRCERQIKEFIDEVGDADYLYKTTGWELSNGLALLQIRWIKDNMPDIHANAKMFLSVPDYITYKLTGKTCIDLSNLGINQTGDIIHRKYDEKLLAFMGVDESQLPEIVKSGDIIANLSENAANELGLTTECVMVAGAHDQYATTLGSGAFTDGDMLIGSGTCWVVTAIADKPDFNSRIAQSVTAVEGKWGSCWSLSSGGICLDWIRNKVAGTLNGEVLTYDEISREVEKRKAAEERLFFYPFQGYTDNKTPFTKGSFVGLDLSHDRFNMVKAVMEGIAFQIKWMMEYFNSKPSEKGIILSGGATKSRVWTQIVADIIGLPVRIPSVSDQACIGAAIIAGVSNGFFKSYEEAYIRMADDYDVITPNPINVKKYFQLMDDYKRNSTFLGKMYGII